MSTYRVDSRTVRLEASDDAESVVLEVSRAGIRDRAYRNDPPVISSNLRAGHAHRTRRFLKFIAWGERCGGTRDVRGRGSRNPAVPHQVV